ncbi:hypothetical protein AB0D38_40415 [Streptomyces sp. NPDC048279]|uniref:hypothetical protein n=1 Tax=Streptomyces sp. NPDC048279 TaxID=3154714 RepID=UPI00342DD0B4
MRHIDPTGRALHVSVGCALFNPRAVAAHFGWEPVSRLLPCPEQPDLLATVRLAGASRTSVSPAPYEAVWRRHSSRFPFSDRALPATVVTELRDAAGADGADLHPVSPTDVSPLPRLISEAEHRNAAGTGRAAEDRRWVHAADGLTPEVLGPQDFRERVPMRDFGAHRRPGALTAGPGAGSRTRPAGCHRAGRAGLACSTRRWSGPICGTGCSRRRTDGVAPLRW